MALAAPDATPLGTVASATYLGSRMEYVVTTGFGELLVSAPVTVQLLAPGRLLQRRDLL
ncbi:MAG TPA: TOBE domain-containing protein [Amaricoccus sp.]|uniref:hypothetical protein n=1 Tax=Amaricoccus sp. TaxID=1872485 RepID=UPI002C959257|nr:hypothetical protein [Amaricoccus sp.]HMQ93745.1 TOBE domain-containing protein [Amaricoccus sp.]HMR53595.1 TOBE domain-containing protein [Amaricoccus sp.]HMU00606.1 TOBE domain-containing protein [Amaricoccus sp.]